MRHAARRLEQHQTAFRRSAIEPPAFEIVRQGPEIINRIVAAKAQFEAVLASLRAMAGAGAASQFGEGWLDIIEKADGGGRLKSRCFDSNSSRLPTKRNSQFTGTVRVWLNRAR